MKYIIYNEIIFDNDNLIEYIIERINYIDFFILLNDFIKKNILPFFKLIPIHLKSIFFELIIISLYQTTIRISLQNISYSILNFGDFSTALTLSRFQFYGKINSASSFIRNISEKNNELNEYIDIQQFNGQRSVGGEMLGRVSAGVGGREWFIAVLWKKRAMRTRGRGG